MLLLFILRKPRNETLKNYPEKQKYTIYKYSLWDLNQFINYFLGICYHFCRCSLLSPSYSSRQSPIFSSGSMFINKNGKKFHIFIDGVVVAIVP